MIFISIEEYCDFSVYLSFRRDSRGWQTKLKIHLEDPKNDGATNK